MDVLISFFFASQLLNTNPSLNLNTKLGMKIYAKKCKVCHGIKGNADTFASQVLDPPPRDFTSKKSKSELTEERMIYSATNGRVGTAMMPWKNILSPEEIRAVIRYIRKILMEL